VECTVSNSTEDPVLAHTEEPVYHLEALADLFLGERNIWRSLCFVSPS